MADFDRTKIFFEGTYMKFTCVYCSLDEVAREDTAHPGIVRVLVIDHRTDGAEVDGYMIRAGYFCRDLPMGRIGTNWASIQTAIEEL
jgi:hypothetical protein